MKTVLSFTFLALSAFCAAQTLTAEQGSQVKQEAIVFTVSFTANTHTICAGEYVQFTGSATPSASAWTWQLPGSVTPSASVQNPLVQYTTPGNYNVILSASNETDQATLGKLAYISVQNCNGMQQISHSPAFSLCPNPASTQLAVSCELPSNYVITDCTGKIVQSGVIENRGTSILAIDALAPGIYYVSLTSENAFHSTKFVKEQ